MGKWIRRALAALALALIALVGVVLWAALRPAHPVGFTIARVDPAAGRPFALAIWYPTSSTPWPTTLVGNALTSVARDGEVQGRDLPLVVVSHGNGGGVASHVDLALALADSGYVVAAPMHSGDNVQDSSGLASPTFWSDRNHELRAAIDYMLGRWAQHARVDGSRIGAFGFSAGGFTVLTAVGGHPDLGLVASHCATAREFVCDVLRAAGSPLLTPGAQADRGFVTDARIKAAVVAAPGLGFAFGTDGLRDVRVPIQMWMGDVDRVVPAATNAALIRRQLSDGVEVHSVPGAGHASFLAPCRLLGPPALCADEAGFDRPAFHARMNADVVQFFGQRLGVVPAGGAITSGGPPAS